MINCYWPRTKLSKHNTIVCCMSFKKYYSKPREISELHDRQLNMIITNYGSGITNINTSSKIFTFSSMTHFIHFPELRFSTYYPQLVILQFSLWFWCYLSKASPPLLPYSYHHTSITFASSLTTYPSHMLTMAALTHWSLC